MAVQLAESQPELIITLEDNPSMFGCTLVIYLSLLRVSVAGVPANSLILLIYQSQCKASSW
jgi:hypothetical protein